MRSRRFRGAARLDRSSLASESRSPGVRGREGAQYIAFPGRSLSEAAGRSASGAAGSSISRQEALALELHPQVEALEATPPVDCASACALRRQHQTIEALERSQDRPCSSARSVPRLQPQQPVRALQGTGTAERPPIRERGSRPALAPVGSRPQRTQRRELRAAGPARRGRAARGTGARVRPAPAPPARRVRRSRSGTGAACRCGCRLPAPAGRASRAGSNRARSGWGRCAGVRSCAAAAPCPGGGSRRSAWSRSAHPGG